MTNIHLLNVPFESNYKDTVWFENRIAQTNYMSKRSVRAFPEFSYQRKDSVIRIPAHIDTLYNCNYVQYDNKIGDKTKRFYAFITDMKYVNDERTDITIKTDVIQTWMFKEDGTPGYVVKPSFVEREHIDDDTIGINTVPEMLETGEYVCDGVHHKTQLYDKVIVVGSTIKLDDYNFLSKVLGGNWTSDMEFTAFGGAIYNGTYSGVGYYVFKINTDTIKYINNVLKAVADAGKSDAIVSMFVAPDKLISYTWNDDGDAEFGIVTQSYGAVQQPWNAGGDTNPEMPTKLNGYTPRNKKLLTYPYCYLYGSNNGGSANVYHYEYFEEYPDFEVIGAITPSMSVRLIPLKYKGVAQNNDEGLTLGKFPICAWTTDVYTNWLTQNSLNIATDIITGVASIGIGAVTGGIGALGIVSGVGSIANTVGEIYKHSLIPPAVNGNMNSGDVSCADNLLTFSLYKMSIKKEFAQIIDEYFDMFGYKVNRVKVPNVNHRSRYWYTKTIDVNIDGAIPNKDLDEIKQCYNRGITFWKNGNDMGNYATNENPNNIV